MSEIIKYKEISPKQFQNSRFQTVEWQTSIKCFQCTHVKGIKLSSKLKELKDKSPPIINKKSKDVTFS